MAWWIVGILSVVVLLLSLSLYIVIRKATYMSKKERDFVIFVIDIYIDYAEELKLTSVKEHNLIVDNLTKLKEKIEKL